MLCKFTMDAIQLIFFLFLSMIYKKKLGVGLLFWIKKRSRHEKIVVSAMQNCRVIR